MTIADRVKDKRIKLGLTQAELAKLIGITQQSLQKIEDGKTQNPRKLLALSKALDCDPEWLQFGEGGEIRESFPNYEDVGLSTPLCKARPIIRYDQVAKWPEINLENNQAHWQNTPSSASDNSFWLKVIGDHMTSLSGLCVPEGYLILVEPDLTAQHGDLVIARMKKSDEVTFKQLITDTGRTYLKSLNTSYHPIEVTDNFQIVGVVTESRSVFKL